MHAWETGALEPGAQWARVAGAAKQGGQALEALAIFMHAMTGFKQWQSNACEGFSNQAVQEVEYLHIRIACWEVLAVCTLAAAKGATITARTGSHIEICLRIAEMDGAMNARSEHAQGALDAMGARSESLFGLLGEGAGFLAQGGLAGLGSLAGRLAAERLSSELGEQLPQGARRGRPQAL